MHKVLTVFGTRPEAVKLASVIRALETSDGYISKVCVTGQHREMITPFLGFFSIAPDWDLEVMKPDQSLPDLTSTMLDRLQGVLDDEDPDLILVQGDTTTAFVAALAGFYRKIPVGHVEAGLRSGDKLNPFPEEVNRRLTDELSDFLFAPTTGAKANLDAEGFPSERIWVTGNTAIDAILAAVNDERLGEVKLPIQVDSSKRLVVVTAHRRESFGVELANICRALKRLAIERDDIEIVYPVHLNPHVRGPIRRMLADVINIHLLEPMPYLEFTKLLSHAYLVLTDSGGIQEEVPSLNLPVLVMRRTTERPEVIEVGAGKLIGTRTEAIVAESNRLLDDPNEYERMATARNPFGDGKAGGRIATAISDHFQPYD